MSTHLIPKILIVTACVVCAAVLQGCADSCTEVVSNGETITVCCPSVFCKNDNGCCMRDPLNLCADQNGNGTGRLLQFVLDKRAAGGCVAERLEDPMIENGKVDAPTTTSTLAST
mmetsp:Transcript_21554/g.40561  ORF Transcript_21554/g.40561 Transcript_21554/m.40561 type:complete len:115 (+) Transcript_21554:44-388(+)